ncbi:MULTISPECIES: class I SAM-dependent DNA methyltransferase [unclassified Azospirillum]|uniref:HsdM family class I SAM-dependent methyltransferase n=1 Tax=unclassified Azospirillum TaxID=2630922 RepID=UPI000B677069|nr:MULTISPECIES: Eco57I restriction-modification methylase domain-containing protein [unclassified Azospirillum]SNR87009.1 adenine-specific DNA-methyltransferase [Azospirillum sp. RU38E]SNS03214.1 adenine-specific DNA-methyltransferase [Azospirillum sp. RU37A]
MVRRTRPVPSPAKAPRKRAGALPADGSALLLAAAAALAAQQRRHVAAIAGLVVQSYWAALETGLPIASPPPELPARLPVGLDEAMREQATRWGADLAPLPVPLVCEKLGNLYAGLLSAEHRARHGVFYTPASLASCLADQAEGAGLDWVSARVLDPASGCGAFLVACGLRMAGALRNVEPALAARAIATRLRGWELDPVAAWISVVMLEAALLPLLHGTGQRLGDCVQAGDSLDRGEDPCFDLVIGNPPYGRQVLPKPVRARFARSLFGHANLYGVFMDLAVRLARPGGLVCFLTPSSFLGGDYFKHLRRTLAEEAPPLRLDFVEQRKGVFDNVLQETVLATYRRAGGGVRRPRRAEVRMIQIAQGGGIGLCPAGHFTLPADVTAPWILPRHAGEADLAASLRAMGHRLADWGYGVSTGPLVWNRHKPQIGDAKGRGAIPLVWAESITPDGRFAYRCQKANHKPWFIPGPGDDWLVIRQPCVLLQRTTAKEQARRLIAAEMPASFITPHGGVTVENHVNMLVPRVARPPVSPAVLAAFLNSRAADRAFRCLSGSVAVSAFELQAMPLPDPKALAPLARLVAQGATRDALDAACDALYGL